MAGRAINRLSARFVATCTEAGRHADGQNLYLSISPNGGRRWVLLYRYGGRQKEMGLGSVRDVSLAKARERAAEARALLADNIDPMNSRADAAGEAASVPTFEEAATAHIAAMESGWKNEKHVAQWRMTTGEAYCRSIASKRVDEITTDDVLAILRPIWLTKAETASRLRGRIEIILDSAKAQGHRSGENPARLRGHLSMLLPPRRRLEVEHHASMPYSDLPAFMALLQDARGVSPKAVEFLILTAARTGEVRKARWREIDMVERVWNTPGEHMKGGKLHRVPLSDRALQVLQDVSKIRLADDPDAYIFPGMRSGSALSDMTLKAVLRRLGKGEFTPHGFRSSFRDWCGEETTFPREVAEMALSHVVGNAVERAYRRGNAMEKRRVLMSAWADYCSPALGDPKVVRIR